MFIRFNSFVIEFRSYALNLQQAGAKHVYAVEASEMAEYARVLIAGNPALSQRITVSFF